MESGAKFENLKKAYLLRGLTLTENGELHTPAGWLTCLHVGAEFNGDVPTKIQYRSKVGLHDAIQTYDVKDGAMVPNYVGK
jgi:hypothetical protein